MVSRQAPGLHVGDINVDVLLQLPTWPHPGHEVMLKGVEWHPGGSATNTALTVARWGFPVRLVARLGQGPWGRILLERLKRIPCLDTTWLQQDPKRSTGTVFVLVDAKGERTFLTHRGANDNLAPPRWENLFTPSPAYVHLTGFSALAPGPRRVAETLLSWAQNRAVAVALDVALYPAQHAASVLRQWARRTTLLSLTVEEARLLLDAPSASPESLLRRLTRWASIVALRMGQQGAWLAWHEETHRFPPLPLSPRDATGAGDAFTAGLLVGWRLGWDGLRSGWLAHLMGALTTTVIGAGDVLPDPDRVRRWMQKHAHLVPTEVLEGIRTMSSSPC